MFYLRKVMAPVFISLGLITACGSDKALPTDQESSSTEKVSTETAEPTETIRLVTHGSFAVSDDIFVEFEDQTGIRVEVLMSGDAGTMLAESILTAGNPIGDVIFGIDNTFMQRAIQANVLEQYRSPQLEVVLDEFEIDDLHYLTPISFGDVCVNYWIDSFSSNQPTKLSDLTQPQYANELVVQNPETSSPGLAFLLATIAGTPDWEQYWKDLRDNGVAITSGWEDAYYGEFKAGGGDRSMVVSYASSPPAEVLYADPPTDQAPTAVLLDSCYRQIEFAGVLAGTKHREAAESLIDFMLSPRFQNDVPLNMFVFPVIEGAVLPQEFIDHAQVAESPLVIDPAEIESNRDMWTDRWVEIVLG